MTTLKKIRLFWAWEDEKEEAWLNSMAQQGWHFTNFGLPGTYYFEQGAPRNDIYRLDYQLNPKDKTAYLQLFQDAGWENVGAMGGWQYFRKSASPGEQPEIYTDNESKARKYSHLMLILVVFLPIYINLMLTAGRSDREYAQIAGVCLAGLMLVYIFTMLKLIQRISALRKQI